MNFGVNFDEVGRSVVGLVTIDMMDMEAWSKTAELLFRHSTMSSAPFASAWIQILPVPAGINSGLKRRLRH